ncbi:MAG: hypothetical protein CL581_11880 [Alteromonadaceae bacterium]|nr:hypothetical protein [Alteromonadaceae bacterium]MBH86886.1 hypothetical protein [Alteromonadaceae bacterium]
MALLAGVTAQGCSSRGMYESTQQRRVDDCSRIINTSERAQCEERARMPYDQYKRETLDEATRGAD